MYPEAPKGKKREESLVGDGGVREIRCEPGQAIEDVDRMWTPARANARRVERHDPGLLPRLCEPGPTKLNVQQGIA